MTSPSTLWQTKLAARLHDPAEKALVLLRDPAGHENGTSKALARLLGYHQLGDQIDPDNDQALIATLFRNSLPASIYRILQRADWWAAAADRPNWPMDEIEVTTRDGKQKTLAVDGWAQVRWSKNPELVHPLTGETIDLGSLAETEIKDFKQRSFDHFATLVAKLGGTPSSDEAWRKMLLAFWRFGPDLGATGADREDFAKLGVLWELLPADTRVPDHSIWDHLDLTSAFAGAFAGDPKGEAALLTMSLGPVQSFIAAARKMDDLWAGSHLLSRLSWELMRPLAEALGPDAILFPRLRGIPQVDLWLRDQMKCPAELFTHCPWKGEAATDANPLFAAALPNRFVAVVPASRARELAEACTQAVRCWLAQLGRDVVSRLLKAAELPVDDTKTPYEQMEAQLAGFPEVHWAAVPFALARPPDAERQRDLDTSALEAAMAPFFGSGPAGFLASPAWQVLAQDVELQAQGRRLRFFSPNPGVLYPAVFELAERMLAAAKSLRGFDALDQHGWRDSLSGEAEWLCADRQQLALPPGQRQDTLWTRVAKARPAWARKGEHLGGLSAIKRLWPNVFSEEVGKALAAGEQGEQRTISRFVVSTHTMALAHQLDQWLERGGLAKPGLSQALNKTHLDAVALPRRLSREHYLHEALGDARRIPALLDAARESEQDEELRNAEKLIKDTLGQGRLETYYALLMMDGDRMGAILSGDTATGTAIAYRQSFHSQVRQAFDQRAASEPRLKAYGNQPRAISPGRHLAISAALNDFSQTVARQIVEEEQLGRLIYAGGDDVLAMLPVADLLPTLQKLRDAYSGEFPEDAQLDWKTALQQRKRLHCRNGFALLNGRLMRMMGKHATASTGAVIAHHQAPLSAVLRELRAAEQRAKREGGRDAFSITVVKRSGGALHLTAKWGEPLGALRELVEFLRGEDTSRRAVYHSLAWLKDLPEPEGDGAMLSALLAYQFARQSAGAGPARPLAERLTALALEQPKGTRKAWLAHLLSIAEFLARETRGPAKSTAPATAKETAA